MAALPIDGPLGLRPEEDYSYADQPWNRSFLFGMSYGTLLGSKGGKMCAID